MSWKLSNVEQKWFVSVMALYGLVLIFFEATIGEIFLVLVVLTASWYLTSYLIRGEDEPSLQKEIRWFGGILVLLLLVLLIIGPITGVEIAIFTGTYTVVWIIRSLLIKRFS
ncbi:MAG: hypothetical protein ACXAE3_09275 [Candidatus Kariarchaeaceae archaeon]|jgi:hypothetical protein